MAEIPVFEVALAYINFIDAFLFQIIFQTTLKFTQNGRMPLRPVVKKALETETKFRILVEIVFKREAIRIVSNDYHIPVIKPQAAQVAKNKINPKAPEKNLNNENGEKAEKVISWNEIGLGSHDVN
jgi:hypothetical protein